MDHRDALTLVITLLVVSAGLPASAQDAPKMKMTTDIPPSITMPDTVETRIGTLKFFDGFPDKATVEKVYDNLDFQRGVQAYLTALPAVSIEGARKGFTGFGPVNQTVLISEQLLDSKSLFLTANTTTPYSVLYLDTKDGRWSWKSLQRCSARWMMLGFAGLLMSALPDRTKARAESICCCRPATRARSLKATLLRVRAPLETCCFSELS